MDKKGYWNNNGKYQDKYNEYLDRYKSDGDYSIESEMFISGKNIYNNWFKNNGFKASSYYSDMLYLIDHAYELDQKLKNDGGVYALTFIEDVFGKYIDELEKQIRIIENDDLEVDSFEEVLQFWYEKSIYEDMLEIMMNEVIEYLMR
jgi:hypothetical protein